MGRSSASRTAHSSGRDGEIRGEIWGDLPLLGSANSSGRDSSRSAFRATGRGRSGLASCGAAAAEPARRPSTIPREDRTRCEATRRGRRGVTPSCEKSVSSSSSSAHAFALASPHARASSESPVPTPLLAAPSARRGGAAGFEATSEATSACVEKRGRCGGDVREMWGRCGRIGAQRARDLGDERMWGRDGETRGRVGEMRGGGVGG